MKMNTDNYVHKLSLFHELVAKQLKSTKKIYKLLYDLPIFVLEYKNTSMWFINYDKRTS